MAATETYGVMGFVDENGRQKIHYPVTQAELVSYNNTNSKLRAGDTQEAIDELATGKLPRLRRGREHPHQRGFPQAGEPEREDKLSPRKPNC